MTVSSFNARALAALGHDVRLAIFRLLVRHGDSGLRVGEIADSLDIAASTLAHHLSTLVAAKLVVQQKIGREVFSRVDYSVAQGVVSFLTSECCAGVTFSQMEDAA